jgi:NADH dehydrogenase [ubiquinone] 1 alpha subcomplex assembly factor 1
MEGANELPRHPRTLFTLNSEADLKQFAFGCDRDYGGTSTVNFKLEESRLPHGTRQTAKLWGDMQLAVTPKSKLKKGGYAAIKSKVGLVLHFPSSCNIYPQARTDPLYLATFLKA